MDERIKGQTEAGALAELSPREAAGRRGTAGVYFMQNEGASVIAGGTLLS